MLHCKQSEAAARLSGRNTQLFTSLQTKISCGLIPLPATWSPWNIAPAGAWVQKSKGEEIRQKTINEDVHNTAQRA